MMGVMGVMGERPLPRVPAPVEFPPESGATSIAVGQLAHPCARARRDFALSARAARDLELIPKDGMTVA
jgi:hypothetical protein